MGIIANYIAARACGKLNNINSFSQLDQATLIDLPKQLTNDAGHWARAVVNTALGWKVPHQKAFSTLELAEITAFPFPQNFSFEANLFLGHAQFFPLLLDSKNGPVSPLATAISSDGITAIGYTPNAHEYLSAVLYTPSTGWKDGFMKQLYKAVTQLCYLCTPYLIPIHWPKREHSQLDILRRRHYPPPPTYTIPAMVYTKIRLAIIPGEHRRRRVIQGARPITIKRKTALETIGFEVFEEPPSDIAIQLAFQGITVDPACWYATKAT